MNPFNLFRLLNMAIVAYMGWEFGWIALILTITLVVSAHVTGRDPANRAFRQDSGSTKA